MKGGFRYCHVKTAVCVALSLVAMAAFGESKAQKAFLERVASVSTIDDAHITDDALVIWPSPDVQAGLDYEAMGVQLCLEYKTYRYLVVWFMDSSLYRSTKKMQLLESYICIK